MPPWSLLPGKMGYRLSLWWRRRYLRKKMTDQLIHARVQMTSWSAFTFDEIQPLYPLPPPQPIIYIFRPPPPMSCPYPSPYSMSLSFTEIDIYLECKRRSSKGVHCCHHCRDLPLFSLSCPYPNPPLSKIQEQTTKNKQQPLVPIPRIPFLEFIALFIV